MKVLIIEDEALSARALERSIKSLRPEWEIAGKTSSIEASLRFLVANTDLDIIFADIRLDDGLSFAIFNKIETKASVVFVTGFDEYALQAFDYNCADYILKPVQKADLEKALQKCEERFPRLSPSMLQTMSQDIMQHKVKYRKRLLLEQGPRTMVAPIEEVAYISADNGGTKVFLKDKSFGYLDLPLSRIEAEMDPDMFVRASRQFIIALDMIKAFDELPSKREFALVLCEPYSGVDIHITPAKRNELIEQLY